MLMLVIKSANTGISMSSIPLNKFVSILKNYWSCPAACGIMVPWPGTEPRPSVLTVREES